MLDAKSPKKKDLIKILSLGYLPPVNNYHPINHVKDEEVFFPSDLVYSKSSKLVQLRTIVNKEIIFPKSYPYTSSTTEVLRKILKNCIESVKKFQILRKVT